MIYALPVADFKVPATSCQGQPITVTDQSTTTAGAIILWHWNFGGADTIYRSGNPFQLTPAGTGKYTTQLFVETDKGCRSQAVKQITDISPQPVANFIVPAVCINDAFAQFSDSSYQPGNPTAALSFHWRSETPQATPANPDTSIVKNPKHTYPTAGNYAVVLRTTNASGCTSSVTKPVQVNGLPTADFMVLGNTNLCSNQPVQIRNTSVATVGAITRINIIWDANFPNTDRN